MKRRKISLFLMVAVCILVVIACLCACNDTQDEEIEYEWIAGEFVKTNFWYNGMYVSEQAYEFSLNGGLKITVSGIVNNKYMSQSVYAKYLLKKNDDYIYYQLIDDTSDKIIALHYCGTYIETDFDKFELDGQNSKGEFAGRIAILTYNTDQNGHIDGSASQCIAKGSNGSTVTAVPASGFEFVRWSDGVTTASRTDMNVQSNIEVSAEFRRLKDVIILSYYARTNGRIEGNARQTVQPNGNGTTVKAIPNYGYVFEKWSDGVTTAERTDTNVTSDIIVEAQFREISDGVVLHYYLGGNGRIEGELIQNIERGGNGTTVRAIPNDGYVFDKWSDGVTTAERTDVNVTEDMSVTAMFKKACILSYIAGSNGRIEGDARQTVQPNGNGTTVKAIPNDGYVFDKWSDGVTTAERTDMNVTEDISVTAMFVQRYYTVTFDNGYDGIKSQVRIAENGKIEITAPTRKGYEFNGWRCNGYWDKYNSGDIISVTQDMTLCATWSIIQYNISYELQGGTLDSPRTTFTINDLPFNLPIAQAQDDTYGFAYWTTDEEGVNKIFALDKSDKNLKDFTFFAHYENSSQFMTFSYDAQSNGYAVNKYSGNARTVVIPSTYKGIAVTAIGYEAFQYCRSLTGVLIPNSVTSIGYDAFSSCSSLTSVVIPNSVTSIGSRAFYNCSSLMSVVIPDGVTSIGSSAFYNCSSLTSVVIPDGVTSIESYAFQHCSSLTSIVIPNGVTSIGSGAFQYCSSLTSVVIPDSVTKIDWGAFNACDKLETVYVGSANAVNKTDHNLFDNAKDVYILEGTEVTNSLFENLYNRQEGTVSVNGLEYIHYVYKF